MKAEHPDTDYYMVCQWTTDAWVNGPGRLLMKWETLARDPEDAIAKMRRRWTNTDVTYTAELIVGKE